MKQYNGKLVCSPERKIALVVSRWNDFFTEKMLSGALDTLLRSGAVEENLTVCRVPGAWEIPLAVQRLLQAGELDGVVALGCLIKGATPHFEYIASEVTKNLAKVSLENNVPVTYGVITVHSLEQAIERSGSKAGNKGGEAASSLVEMVELFAQMEVS